MRDIAANNYIVDGNLINSSDVIGFDDNKVVVIYEVIRVINRVGMFLEDHLERLKKSLKKANIHVPEHLKDTTKYISELGEINNIFDYNIKILVTLKSEDVSTYAIYVMKHLYPSEVMFKQGINVGLMHWERKNPNTKTVNSNFKDIAAKLMEDENVFEVLLLNSQNYITEGSRTNVFFVSGSEVITADSTHILEGITRKYVFAACERAGIKIREELIKTDEVNGMDGAFISGTSLKVLPIAKVEEIPLKSASNLIVGRIIEEYDKIMDNYIKTHK